MRINLQDHEVEALVAGDKKVTREVINKIALLYLKQIMKKAKEAKDAKV